MALMLIGAASAGSHVARCQGHGGIGATGHHCTQPVHPYVNPIRGTVWLPGRIDMGVDYSVTRAVPVRAIGDARIIGSDSHSSWPHGHFIWYRLLDGDHRGDIIYVAETMTKLAAAGTLVKAGQRIGTALPGGTGPEWGWAMADGETRAAPCYREGMNTHSGREMAAFLRSLGAKTVPIPGQPPNHPTGPLC